MTPDFENFIRSAPEPRKPHLRLFFSADIVGSTAYKQKHLDAPETWFNAVLSFYRQAEEGFARIWGQYRSGISADPARAEKLFGEAPELWKTVGDEVLFSKRIKHPGQVIGALHAWIATLAELREFLLKRGLDVKSSAWLADFPIRNSEVVLRKKFDPDSSDSQHINANDHLLAEFYKNPDGYARDFIGPLIDTGFRLGAYASSRKLVISIELAYLLGAEQIGTHEGGSDYSVGAFGFRPFSFRYDGRVFLKGVMNGSGYPVFWLDLAPENPLNRAEDILLGSVRSTASVVSGFAKSFIGENLTYLSFPYIISSLEVPKNFNQIPQKDIDWLLNREAEFAKMDEHILSEGEASLPGQSSVPTADLSLSIKSTTDASSNGQEPSGEAGLKGIVDSAPKPSA